MTTPPQHSPGQDSYDVAIVGGGHNGLVAAAYLARAGLSVVLLERLDHLGGAAVSAPAFPGRPTRLSRYSYLVSVLPQRLITDLELDVQLVSRHTASYTPILRHGTPDGLLVERPEGEATRASFRRLTGTESEYAAWRDFYDEVEQVAGVLAPTLTEPLPTEADVRGRLASAGVDQQIWSDLVDHPLGEALRRRFADDLVRGVIGTDALIGTFASLDDASLAQNRCFLYHLIGNGTGEWRVPIGGMGAVTDAMARAASEAGAKLVTGAEVTAIQAGSDGAQVETSGGGSVRATRVLAGVAPYVLSRLLGEQPGAASPPSPAAEKPSGSQLKINLLLDRLPRLRSGVDPEVAFAGTFHLAESFAELEEAYAEAAAGRLPQRPPGEVYCHSLTDPSILGDVPPGTHTLTYFGLHTPAELFIDDPAGSKRIAAERALEVLDEHLAEPLTDCVAADGNGNPCIEVKSPLDIEADLAMPGGHIFHGDLAWPWLPDEAPTDTPAQRWGVETGVEAVLLCGSGARRGGAVSGLGGHHAAQAVLESM